MIIGIPKEIKEQESRVAAVPAMIHNLVEAGHEVLVERGGGLGAGIADARELIRSGAAMEKLKLLQDAAS